MLKKKKEKNVIPPMEVKTEPLIFFDGGEENIEIEKSFQPYMVDDKLCLTQKFPSVYDYYTDNLSARLSMISEQNGIEYNFLVDKNVNKASRGKYIRNNTQSIITNIESSVMKQIYDTSYSILNAGTVKVLNGLYENNKNFEDKYGYTPLYDIFDIVSDLKRSELEAIMNRFFFEYQGYSVPEMNTDYISANLTQCILNEIIICIADTCYDNLRNICYSSMILDTKGDPIASDIVFASLQTQLTKDIKDIKDALSFTLLNMACSIDFIRYLNDINENLKW